MDVLETPPHDVRKTEVRTKRNDLEYRCWEGRFRGLIRGEREQQGGKGENYWNDSRRLFINRLF